MYFLFFLWKLFWNILLPSSSVDKYGTASDYTEKMELVGMNLGENENVSFFRFFFINYL